MLAEILPLHMTMGEGAVMEMKWCVGNNDGGEGVCSLYNRYPEVHF